MISLEEALLPGHINLSLVADNKSAAIREVVGTLRGDSRVENWNELEKSILERNAPAVVSGGCGICIAHGRTSAVSSIVMAAGRSEKGISFSEIEVPVRLIFVAGIPVALSSEYLRLVGAIARICRDEVALHKLLALKDPQKFVDFLKVEENRLQ